MSNAGEVEVRSLSVTVPGVPNPVLYAKDAEKIKDDSVGQVHVRVRAERNGIRKLILKSHVTCEEAVFEAARLQAIETIRYNHENFREPTSD